MSNRSIYALDGSNSKSSLFSSSATVVQWKLFLSSLRIYVIAFFTFIGLILNSLCILINIKYNMRLKSVNINKTYIVGLATFDLIKLVVESAFPLAELNYNWLVTDQWCQWRYWLKYTSGETCSWILVVMSIDRILAFVGHKYSRFAAASVAVVKATQLPHLVERNMRRNSLITVALIVLVFSAINSVFFLKNTIYSVKTSADILKCQNRHRGFGFHVFQHTWFNLTWFQTFYSLAYSFVPAAVLVVTNAIIIKIIHKYSVIARKFNRSNSAKKLRKLKESGLVLVFLSAFFLVSTLPVQISILCIDIYYNRADVYLTDLAHCFYYFFSMLEASNHSCNFLIYILIDKTIRNQFFMFFKQ